MSYRLRPCAGRRSRRARHGRIQAGHEQDLRFCDDPAIEQQGVASLKVGTATFRDSPGEWDAQARRTIPGVLEERGSVSPAAATGEVGMHQGSRACRLAADGTQDPPQRPARAQGGCGGEAEDKGAAIGVRGRNAQERLARGRVSFEFRGLVS